MAELNNQGNSSPKRRGRSARPLPKVDLTAMVDLAFLLITFFMLTTTLAKQNAMDMFVPDNKVETPQPYADDRTMNLLIGEKGILWFMGAVEKPLTKPEIIQADSRQIRQLLLSQKAAVKASTQKEMLLIVKPGNTSSYKDLVNVLDEISLTNINSYALADINPAEIKELKQQKVY